MYVPLDCVLSEYVDRWEFGLRADRRLLRADTQRSFHVRRDDRRRVRRGGRDVPRGWRPMHQPDVHEHRLDGRVLYHERRPGDMHPDHAGGLCRARRGVPRHQQFVLQHDLQLSRPDRRVLYSGRDHGSLHRHHGGAVCRLQRHVPRERDHVFELDLRLDAAGRVLHPDAQRGHLHRDDGGELRAP